MNVHNLLNTTVIQTTTTPPQQNTQQSSSHLASWHGRSVNFMQGTPSSDGSIAPPNQQDPQTQATFLKTVAHRQLGPTSPRPEGYISRLTSDLGNSIVQSVIEDLFGMTAQSSIATTHHSPAASSVAYVAQENLSALTEDAPAAPQSLLEQLVARYPKADRASIETALDAFAEGKNIDMESAREFLLDEAISVLEKREKLTSTLTEREYVALYLYTSIQYRNINRALRDNDPAKLAEWQHVIDDMQSGLQKLGQSLPLEKGLIFRGTHVGERNRHAKLADFEEGKTVKDQAFVSTSTDRKVAERFARKTEDNGATDEGPMVLHMFTGKNRADIAPLSGAPGEAEVLLPPNTEFRVAFMAYDAKNQLYKAVLTDNALPAERGQRGYADALIDPPTPKNIPLNELHRKV